MADLKALILGLDAVLDHPLTKGPHGRHIVDEDVVAEVAGAAVQGGHLGEELGGLKALLRGHAGGAASGGDQDDARTGRLDGFQHYAEPFPVLGGGAVVPTDMHMNDRRARIIRALGLSYHLLHGVGDSGAVFLGDLRAAYGCGNDEFFHHSHFLS